MPVDNGVYSASVDSEDMLERLGVDSENNLTKSGAKFRLKKGVLHALPESTSEGIFNIILE